MKRKMIRSGFQLAAVVLLLTICVTSQAQLKVVGYIYTTTNPNAVDFTKITHLNIAFENPDAAGNLSYNSGNTALITKAKTNDVKILVSICGGGESNNATMRNRYFSLISDAKSAAFIAKIVTYLSDHNFDGIDIDLEGPAINSDYGKFITDLRAALPEGALLTAALSHVNGGDLIPTAAVQLFDFINIMAYDATGPWNPTSPGPHSTYEFAVSSLDWWVDNKELAKGKAILGVPFYGYGFGADANEGISYADILTRFGAGAENRDESGNKIYYNGLPTIRKKAQYVVDQEYGGIMIWQLAQDKVSSDSKSLLRAIDKIIKNTVTGITTDQEANLIKLFPNPVESQLNINAPAFKGGQLSIVDTLGKEFLTGKHREFIDASALPAGLYILRLTKDQKSASKKFIKK